MALVSPLRGFVPVIGENTFLADTAAIIGDVVERPGVRTIGLYGVKRTLDLPHAEPLPRIC